MILSSLWLQSIVGSPRTLPRWSVVSAVIAAAQNENCLTLFLLFSLSASGLVLQFLADSGSEQPTLLLVAFTACPRNSTEVSWTTENSNRCFDDKSCCSCYERNMLKRCVHTYHDRVVHYSSHSSGTSVHVEKP